MKQILYVILFFSFIACNKTDKHEFGYTLDNVKWKAKWEQRKDSLGFTDTIKFNSTYNWQISGEGDGFYVANKYALRYKAPISGIYELSVLIDGSETSTQIGKDSEFVYTFENSIDLREKPLQISLAKDEWFWLNIFGLDVESKVNNIVLEVVNVKL